MSGDDLDLRRRRAAYRAGHRGTKEMDWLLGRYAAKVLPALEGEKLSKFERLLSLPDPDLHQWILHPDQLEQSEFAETIRELRVFHQLETERSKDE